MSLMKPQMQDGKMIMVPYESVVPKGYKESPIIVAAVEQFFKDRHKKSKNSSAKHSNMRGKPTHQ